MKNQACRVLLVEHREEHASRVMAGLTAGRSDSSRELSLVRTGSLQEARVQLLVGDYDAILMDAYARQVSIPAPLATKEFFELAHSRLRKGGVLFVNQGALRAGGELVLTIADTMHAGFGGPVFRAPLKETQNVLLVSARDERAPPPPAESRLDVTWSFALHIPGDRILTDDFCPVESITTRDMLLER